MRLVKGMLSIIMISGLLYVGIFNYNAGNIIEHASNISQSGQDEWEHSFSPSEKVQVNDLVFIGMTDQELEQMMGKPNRIDPTPYGYEWWVFNQEWLDYILIGVQDGRVVTYYTNSPTWGWKDLSPGMFANEWSGKKSIKSEVSFLHNLGFYTFTLTKAEQAERPLFVDDKLAVQVYVDVHDRHRISGIRVMNIEILLLQRPYALKYSGELPSLPQLSDDDWFKIAKANEHQIFELVNLSRGQYQLHTLDWSEDVASVARGHSADMLRNNYFDHYSSEYGDLVQRLNHGEVMYSSAGENIAWNYIDAPDAHEGWLNSLGHRKNVFKEEFTHLGVGIVEKYYTQNFISR